MIMKFNFKKSRKNNEKFDFEMIWKMNLLITKCILKV